VIEAYDSSLESRMDSIFSDISLVVEPARNKLGAHRFLPLLLATDFGLVEWGFARLVVADIPVAADIDIELAAAAAAAVRSTRTLAPAAAAAAAAAVAGGAHYSSCCGCLH